MKALNLVRFVLATAVLASAAAARSAEQDRPKYGPGAVRLFHARDYIRQHEAPDFWALMPYYAPQQTDSACSVASVGMLINALRAERELPWHEEMATHEGLMKRLGNDQWRSAVADGGDGVTLDQLRELIRQSLRAYGIHGMTVEVVHAKQDLDENLASLRRILKQNEQTAGDFILVNFLQSEFTGEPNGAVGHIAPVAAYDEERDRVLILDPDRRWYEPYWISTRTFAKGMATTDGESGRTRGLIWVRLATAAPTSGSDPE